MARQLVGELRLKDDNELWTSAYLKDELFIHLSRIKDKDPNNDNKQIFLSDYKYYRQAKDLIYRIPLFRPKDKNKPPFIIYIDDLKSNPKLYQEFESFVIESTETEVSFLLKEIAIKFFEAIDYGYTHNSVIPHITVGIN